MGTEGLAISGFELRQMAVRGCHAELTLFKELSNASGRYRGNLRF